MTLTERKTNPVITAMLVETLTQPEMEKASGGCLFYCTMYQMEFFRLNGNTYEFYKCEDCGAEEYHKNGKIIQPSEYYEAEKQTL